MNTKKNLQGNKYAHRILLKVNTLTRIVVAIYFKNLSALSKFRSSVVVGAK